MKESQPAARGILSAFAVALIASLAITTPSRAQVQTFDDVPTSYWAFSFIRTFSANGITAGCGGGNFCPDSSVTRAQMAVFLERGMNGSNFSPPAATGTVFNDVGADDFAASFIEQLAADGITAGCGNGNYCPNAEVTRDQMAVFLLRAKYGSAYSPPSPTGIFADVPTNYWAAAWIEQLAAEGITAGCGDGNYCPEDQVTRAQMAVFMVRTFDLVFSNGAPTADGASYTTSDAAFVNSGLSGSDPEDDPLTFSVVSPPAKGSITLFDPATGAFNYEPSPQQDGLDSFTVTAADPYQLSAEATINIEIFDWVGTQQFGTAADDFATTSGLFFDLNGDLVLGGGTAGQIGATLPAGQRDGWIRKLDRRGNELWTAQFGNANDNNARVVARIPGTNNTVAILTDDDLDTASIVKYDASGNKVFDMPVDYEDQTSLIVGAYWGNVDNNGDIYVLSWITAFSSVMTKVDGVSGTTEWQEVFEGTNDNAITPFNSEWSFVRLRSVDFDSTGNAVVSGWYVPDLGAAPRICETCSFIAKYDTNGNQLWIVETDAFAKECVSGADGEAGLYRVMVAPDGNLWATGWGSSEGNVASPTNVAFGQVSKFSADGTQILWTDCHHAAAPGSEIYSFTPARFATGGDGLILTYDIAPEDLANNPLGSSEMFVTRLSSDGVMRFRRTFALTRADDTAANVVPADVVEDGQGLLYVSGTTDGELQPGGALGVEDVFLIRLDSNGVLVD